VRVGATGVVGVLDPLPDEAVVLPDDVPPVGVVTVVPPDVVPDEEVPLDDVPPEAEVLLDDVGVPPLTAWSNGRNEFTSRRRAFIVVAS